MLSNWRTFTSNSIFLRALALMLLGLFQTGQAWAQAGQPLFCDAQFYQIRENPAPGGSRLLRYPNLTSTPLNAFTNSNAATQIPGTATNNITLNGLGFNHRDNYLYAIAANGAAGSVNLYRIGQSGSELVGAIPGVSNPFIATAGVFDKQGRYYFAGQNNIPSGNVISPSIIYRVDNIPVTGASAGLTIARSYNINVTPLINFGDFAFSDASDGINGTLFGSTNQTGSSQHFRIALNDIASTASVSSVTATGATIGGVGSSFYDRPSDSFFVFSNGANAFYQIQNFASGTPNAVSISAVLSAPLTDNTGTSDGTACIFAGAQQADIRVVKTVIPATPVTVGQTVTFTLAVGNVSGSSPAQSTTIADPLPPGFTFVSATPSSGTYSTATGNWIIPSLPAGTSQTLTIVATVNSLGTSTASFANIASSSGSNQVGTSTVITLPDPTPTNNISTATAVTNRAVSLTIAKTDGVGTVTAGQTTSYTITVSVSPGATASDVANAVLRDPVAPGLQCTIGTPACTVSGTPGSICPVVGGGAGQLSIANLQGAGGVLIPLLKPGSQMVFRVSCGVRATGLP
jgi:uncharacterized repeat protein (TIGR01451 family)